jgi:hypothetical protein
MKRKHILLFIAACVLLCISDLMAGSLIALALVFQMNLLYFEIPLTKTSQLTAVKMFFFTLPLFFFLGAIQSFVTLYFREGQWFLFSSAFILSYFLFFLVNFFSFFAFQYLKENEFNLAATYQMAFMKIRDKKKDLLSQTFILVFLSFVPYLTSDWKIIFSLTAFQLYDHRQRLKPVFGF